MTDNVRAWNINYVRRVHNLVDTSSYDFESSLTVVFRPPIEPRQQTCRSINTLDGMALQTNVAAKYFGEYIRIDATSYTGEIIFAI